MWEKVILNLGSVTSRVLVVDRVSPAETQGGGGQSMERAEGARPERRRKKTETTDLSVMA